MTEQLKGVGVVRIPPGDNDPSEMDINNIVSLSTPLFENIFVFEDKLNNTDVKCIDVQKSNNENIITRISSHISYQLRLSLAILKLRTQISHIFWHIGGFSLILPILLSKALGIKNVISVSSESSVGHKNRETWGWYSVFLPIVIWWLEALAYALSDTVVVFSESMFEYGPVALFKNKARVLRYNYQEEPENVKPISDRPNVITYVGRMCNYKGADTFAKAVTSLVNKNSELVDRVIFVGDGEIKQDLKYQIQRKCDNSVPVEFTGWLGHEEAMNILEDATLFVLPSESEALPKALLEAMARGVIPIVTPVGSIPDVVDDGHNGYLLDSTDADTLYNKMRLVMKSEQEHTSESAVETIRSEFTYQSVYQDFVEIMAA